MAIHHVELNVIDLDASFAFYQKLFGFLGGWKGERGNAHFAFRSEPYYFWFNRCSPERAADGFDRYRPGLNHIALSVQTRERVDAWHEALLADGRTVLDPPGYYGDGYYAVFFQDPDGMKLEIGHEGNKAG